MDRNIDFKNQGRGEDSYNKYKYGSNLNDKILIPVITKTKP